MCDKEAFKTLDERVDDHESRITRIETSMSDFHNEARTGFADIKCQLSNLYGEKTKWGDLARDIVKRVVTWLLWLIPCLIGIRQAFDYFSTK
jgi:hypothetical protein